MPAPTITTRMAGQQKAATTGSPDQVVTEEYRHEPRRARPKLKSPTMLAAST